MNAPPASATTLSKLSAHGECIRPGMPSFAAVDMNAVAAPGNAAPAVTISVVTAGAFTCCMPCAVPLRLVVGTIVTFCTRLVEPSADAEGCTTDAMLPAVVVVAVVEAMLAEGGRYRVAKMPVGYERVASNATGKFITVYGRRTVAFGRTVIPSGMRNVPVLV